MWHVYLIDCAAGSLYCGITPALKRRLAQHAGRRAGGAKYTRGRKPLRLIASMPRPDQSSALKLERAVKAARRADKLKTLIGAPDHPDTRTNIPSPHDDCPASRSKECSR
ncbi:MAG: GIY-YIG nuclease family protein [Deltaproteobacteria bacterium]|jgi:putative endonuclease|nr:GIY-YIG nuclease family protein [Deltaproteobacteria bacterium]